LFFVSLFVCQLDAGMVQVGLVVVTEAREELRETQESVIKPNKVFVWPNVFAQMFL